MKVFEIFDNVDYNAYDAQHKLDSKPSALKAQQAFAYADGWELHLVPPKPMDQHTGEVFSWTGKAVHEDGNTLNVSIRKDVITVMLSRLDPLHITGLNVRSIESLSDEFVHEYDNQLNKVVQHLSNDIDDKLGDLFNDIYYDSKNEDEAIRRLHDLVYKFTVSNWLKDYEKLSYGAVNSLALAKSLVPRISEEWDKLIDDHLKTVKHREPRGGV